MKISRARSLLIALVVVTAGLATAGPVAATVAPDPVVGPTGWVPDGPVLAVAQGNGRVYVGGAFTGGVAALDASTGALVWKGTTDGPVRALALTPDGTHLLAGGKFTTVSGAGHRRLALLRVSDGGAEPGWRAAAGGAVRDIVVVGGTAYFAGHFTQHDGMAQQGLGAVSVATGANVTDFTTSANDTVYGLATDGSRLFLSGRFTAVDGHARNQVASVTLASRSLDAWAPARGCTGCNVDWDVAVGNGLVYVVGRNYRAVSALDASTGYRRWSSNANGDGQAVALYDGKVWVGGHFAYVGANNTPRKLLAAFDPLTGQLDAFSARFLGGYPGIWALSGGGNGLDVGGFFSAAGPKPNRYPYLALFGSS